MGLVPDTLNEEHVDRLIEPPPAAGNRKAKTRAVKVDGKAPKEEQLAEQKKFRWPERAQYSKVNLKDHFTKEWRKDQMPSTIVSVPLGRAGGILPGLDLWMPSILEATVTGTVDKGPWFNWLILAGTGDPRHTSGANHIIDFRGARLVSLGVDADTRKTMILSLALTLFISCGKDRAVVLHLFRVQAAGALNKLDQQKHIDAARKVADGAATQGLGEGDATARPPTTAGDQIERARS